VCKTDSNRTLYAKLMFLNLCLRFHFGRAQNERRKENETTEKEGEGEGGENLSIHYRELLGVLKIKSNNEINRNQAIYNAFHYYLSNN